MAGRICLAFITICVYISLVHSVRFYLEPGQRRCFSEELPSNSKITGETRIADGKSDMEIDVWITTQKGAVLYHKRAADHGKFTFRTPAISKDHDDDVLDDYDYDEPYEEDTYKICIEHQQPPSRAHPMGTRRMISFVLHQAFNGLKEKGENVAAASDTDRLQASMRQIHTTLSGMIGDLSQLQRRERTLTTRMQKTTSTITYLAILSVVVTVATSALQFKYYRGYFKQKKLC